MEAKVVGGLQHPLHPPLDRLHPDGRGVGFSKENHGGRAAGVCVRVRPAVPTGVGLLGSGLRVRPGLIGKACDHSTGGYRRARRGAGQKLPSDTSASRLGWDV